MSNESVIQPNIEDSITMALLINSMKPFLVEIDYDYLKLSIIEICKKIDDYNSKSATPDWSIKKSQLLNAQANSLTRLYDYINSVKAVEVIKESLILEDKTQDNIEELFL